MPTCDHCLLDFPEGQAVRAEFQGKQRTFCCHGCLGIYQLISNEGCEAFYQRRPDWIPGPAFKKTLDYSAFLEGVRGDENLAETDIVLDGIRCASCVTLNERILLKTNGVLAARINFATYQTRISWNPRVVSLEQILKRIEAIGYHPKPFIRNQVEENRTKALEDLLLRFGTAGFFSMQLMLFSLALYAGFFQGMEDSVKRAFQIISFFLTLPVLFYSGLPFLTGAQRSLRAGAFSMDVLITTGSGSAFVYSIIQIWARGEVYFDTSAMIITLMLLGKYIEERARKTASEAIARLLDLPPREARRLGGMVPISAIEKNDLLEVRPGERIPLDGTVVSGSSESDESMLTGEAKPVPKHSGSEVFAGTLNLHGSFIFTVTKTAKETALAQIVQAVGDAQARQAPIQGSTAKAVSLFVPGILILGILTMLGWLMKGASISSSLLNAISVLVIACPCALGLATPLAILLATASSATQGILIKGGDVLEKASAIDTILFDKTGTITQGSPRLIFYRGLGITDSEALRLCASCEARSEHSIARAIVRKSSGQTLSEVTDFKAFPGNGITGLIDGKRLFVGSQEFHHSVSQNRIQADIAPMLRQNLNDLEKNGGTIVYLVGDGKVSGVFAVADAVRPEARETMETLIRNLHQDIVMITGDAYDTGKAVAEAVGIARVLARMSPTRKAEEVQKLQASGKHVMMIGDGINDSPSLVEADTGVAMGKATDIALESSDIVLMRGDLRLIPTTIRLARKTLRIIRQNIFWAFAYNAIAVPLAIAGLLHPIVAALAMVMSSLTVVGNSFRARI